MGHPSEVIFNGEDFLNELNNLPSISTPLQLLYSQYRQKREALERIADYVAGEGGMIDYFMKGAQQTHGYSTVNMTTLFQKEPAVRALDAEFWNRALRLTDLLEIMPAKRRNEWHAMIRNGFIDKQVPREDRWGGTKNVREPIPAFSESTVESTLRSMLAQRSQLFAERVSGLWDSLSAEHLTNQPQAFGKMMILRRVIDYHGYLDRDMGNYVHDLRAVVASFMGRDSPNENLTHHQLAGIAKDVMHGSGSGKWHIFDGGSWEIRMYKKGTAHMKIHPEMAWRLNAVLASVHPMAIPSEFRQKPKLQPKEVPLSHNLISFEVLADLSKGNLIKDGKGLSFFALSTSIRNGLIEVLEFLGGVRSGKSEWHFDYAIGDVIDLIQQTGLLPDHQAHQFYPTPATLAETLVLLADIQPGETVVEPSAGQGGIAQFLPVEQTVCVEISPLQAKILESKGFSVVCQDFLTWYPDLPVDAIVMNPPFNQGQAAAHVQHAAKLLSNTGRLVAILPASFRGKTVVDGWKHDWSSTKSGAFKGTSVSVVFLTLRR